MRVSQQDFEVVYILSYIPFGYNRSVHVSVFNHIRKCVVYDETFMPILIFIIVQDLENKN